ncbi:MAG: UDP-N-acetylmuramate--L-alanine ligase [Pseudomonadota bacterium]|jgi:UDP-N-acetylmuramate--alanine ligase
MYNPRLHFHFIGIGGSGMSGLAEILLSSGFKVSGSDIKKSDICVRLEQLGAVIHIGHAASNVPPTASLVVYSSAVVMSNPEIREAKRRKLPVVRRAEVLAELMRLKFGVGVAGSHGKTTTTSMTATILDAGKLDPTVVIGGQVKTLGTGARLGQGEYLVAETDESDRSFLLLKPTVAIVTNIDDEHMNAYRSRRDLEDSFRRFIDSVPFYGLAILCVDDPVLRQIARQTTRRVLTYGFSSDADLSAIDVVPQKTGMEFSVVYRGAHLGRFNLPMLGRHLVQNCLGAIAVGLEFGISVDVIKSALAAFQGVKRRLEVVGSIGDVTIMNDYGHHPTEIRATLKAIRECFGGSMRRLVVIFQPHRYTRTQLCWDELRQSFSDADHLIMSEIYAASEEPIVGVSGEALLNDTAHVSKEYCASLDDAPALIKATAESGDVVLCLGAGPIGALPGVLLAALKGEGNAVADVRASGSQELRVISGGR